MNKEKLEKIIAAAIAQKDQGKTAAEILKLYPDAARELSAIFKLVKNFQASQNLVPPPELLINIIKQVPEKDALLPNTKPGEILNQGRPSLTNLLLIQFHQVMTNTAKIGIGVAVLLVIAAAFGVYQLSVAPNGDNEIFPQVSVTTAPAADIDGIADDLVADLAAEETALNQESSDQTLLAADSQTLNDLGQSYDENEL